MAPDSAPPIPPPHPAAEFEREFKWRWWAVVVFLGLMLGLAAVAIGSLVVTPRILTGVPDDADARAAWELMRPGVDARLLELRLDSEIGVRTETASAGAPAAMRRAERAESLLTCALRRHPGDPRIHTAIGHLDLARQLPKHASWSYLAAVDMAPHHDEARLGLGVALARLAELESDPILQRRLELRAIAQLAAVRKSAAVRLDALYDRAWLLADVGRSDEARRFGAEYLAADPASVWAARLRAKLGGG